MASGGDAAISGFSPRRGSDLFRITLSSGEQMKGPWKSVRLRGPRAGLDSCLAH